MMTIEHFNSEKAVAEIESVLEGLTSLEKRMLEYTNASECLNGVSKVLTDLIPTIHEMYDSFSISFDKTTRVGSQLEANVVEFKKLIDSIPYIVERITSIDAAVAIVEFKNTLVSAINILYSQATSINNLNAVFVEGFSKNEAAGSTLSHKIDLITKSLMVCSNDVNEIKSTVNLLHADLESISSKLIAFSSSNSNSFKLLVQEIELIKEALIVNNEYLRELKNKKGFIF